jgi:glutathione synthase/RimK-type ligase-like ATP-grasp enzyme
VPNTLGLPCILKQPDSSFSQGVLKVDTPDEFRRAAATLLENSDLIIAQEFVPTAWDWRVGILDRQPLFVCKYYMVDRHWQIIRHEGAGHMDEGRFETLSLTDAPAAVVKTALKTANLIGDGLYGVDIKEINGQPLVMEINDNPNIESGCEDLVLKQDLYVRIMQSFLRRIELLKGIVTAT